MKQTTLQPLTGKIDFHAQHSPMGAFMSFTCGHFGSTGGIGVEIGRPASQNLFVGVMSGSRLSKAPLKCLPFFRGANEHAGAANYQVEQAAGNPIAHGVKAYDAAQLKRRYGWATDAWETPDFSFTLRTPFGPIPDPDTASADALSEALLPAITGSLEIDNRSGKEAKTAVFAIDFGDPGARILEAPDAAVDDTGVVGFGWRRNFGVMATCEQDGLFPLQRWSVTEALHDVNPVHALGTLAGIGIEVPPGETRTVTLAIGCYLDGVVTTGLEGRYFYTRHYTSLEDVLAAALGLAPELGCRADQLDEQLADSGLSADQQFLIAHATRSYYGSTQLLDVGGEPFWVVNEGEYCMMNTLDLSVDQMFWELQLNPWVVRNLLENFSRRYSYVDRLVSRSGKSVDGGLSFAHDMGVNNNFSPTGHSSYELAHLTGCFSYMTGEQLCNYILMAATYVSKAETGAEWAIKNRHLVEACGQSLLARCRGKGVIELDSSRCEGGAEITTYDSLDHSLAQTRNNLYMAVKSWASYIGLALLMQACGDSGDAFWDQAKLAADQVVRHAGASGVIPAVFEHDNPGHASCILPAIEGLLYPLIWESEALRGEGDFAALLAALSRHTITLLNRSDRPCLFADGGIKLSSTSNNSWMSKIALFQHVAREVLGLSEDPAIEEIFRRADAAHVRWQTEGSAYWACSDQFVSGIAKGSRYYPRIITTAMWLDGQRKSVVRKNPRRLAERY